ncbi:MAG: alpha/beta hydrolase [Verrucomicrobiota bacterium]
MKNPLVSFGFRSCVILIAMTLCSCAHQVRVKEKWDFSLSKEMGVALDDAADTWQQIKSGREVNRDLVNNYNDAVRESVIQIGTNWMSGNRPLGEIKTNSGRVKLDVDAAAVPGHQFFERIVPADFVLVKRGFDKEVKLEGVGAPLVVHQPWTEEDSMMPRSGLWYPITAVLNLDRPENPILVLFDPTKQDSVRLGSREVPLSANYTASFARVVNDRQHLFKDVPALLKFEKFADHMGLHRVSAFDPDKQPCVLIHGINSSPSTWDVTLNEFYRDPKVRERYEFWTFGYPTGASIPFMAAELRDSIEKMRWFRRSNGAASDSIVVVGHSMGGVLAKSLTLGSGDEEWNHLFNVPIDELRVSSRDRENLRRIIYYDPVAEIEKVVMCSTPHRGSRVAEKPGSRLVASLIQLPAQITNIGSELRDGAEMSFTPLGREIAQRHLTSVAQLRPDSPVLLRYLSKSLNPSVRYFSIIAREDSGSEIPLEDSSDGVVDYKSSRLQGVESETVIRNSPHGVHREPEGIAELVRLLNLP